VGIFMYIKAMLLCLSVMQMYGMDKIADFQQALQTKEYAKAKLLLDTYPTLIQDWQTHGKNDKWGSNELLNAIEKNDIMLLDIFLTYDKNLCYKAVRHIFTPIYRAVWYTNVQIVQKLINCYKDIGEPEDLSEYGFYGKRTLQLANMAKDINNYIDRENQTIISALDDLHKRKKIREDIIADLTRHTENKNKRLLDFVEQNKQYTAINYLLQVKRDKAERII